MRKVSFLLAMLVIAQYIFAQPAVGIGTTTPHGSAQLDVVSTTKGFLMPRMTATQRGAIASPAAGLTVFETTTNSIYVFNGTSWLQLASGGVSPWAVSGTNIYNTNTGNVGIGIAAPLFKMHIAGTTLIENGLLEISDNIPTIKLRDGNTLLGFMKVQGTGDLRIGTYVTSNPDGRIMFDIEGLPKVTIAHSGNLGIGTITPGYKLEVNGTVSMDGDLRINDGYMQIYNSTLAKNWQIHHTSSLGGRLVFLSSGFERLVLNNDGNIGMGPDLPITNNGFPNTKLHIESGQDAGLASTNNGYLMLGPSSGSNIVIDNNEIVARTGFTTAGTLFLQNNGGEISTAARLTVDKSGEAIRLTGATPSISFSNNGSSVNGFIAQTGSAMILGENNGKIQLDGIQVAIGAISGAAPAYRLTVAGKVICEEVRVKLMAAWPDYVFGDDYKLRPLSDVEKFIRSNRHLPGIAPAAEIEKEGLDVGEMHKNLLEKIEELTLYIIEQDKRIKQLELRPLKSN